MYDNYLLDIDNRLSSEDDSVALSVNGSAIAYTSDSPLHVSRGDDYYTRTWKANSLDTLPSNFTFSTDGTLLVSWSSSYDSDGSFFLMRSSDGSTIKTVQGDANSNTSLSLSPDGKFIVSGSDNGIVHLWGIIP
ncbi:MAG: hypothetical protein HN736_12650 [Anaerolineae bacterium]|jgi:WD40 repeat protein|nr:hypothetical protein [Anaerolineae bacterium]MBT4311231.1 hypothetical protein [Anaerolineae bacterium]MBT4843565.1 hypothetical protein [Anaerolineae bacterium]MBT6323561.1 hypothetical protein [Anaerolineae bacterium]MBT7015014.1 hypothetical protein [Anaerolineae bacterium]